MEGLYEELMAIQSRPGSGVDCLGDSLAAIVRQVSFSQRRITALEAEIQRLKEGK